MSRLLPPDHEARRRIDRELDRNLLVTAGAGSGKTSKLTDRYLALLDAGYEPPQIAVVTFTRKAATQMRERLRQRLRERAAETGAARWQRRAVQLESAPIATIHSFCGRLLRAEALTAGLDPGFEVLDEPLAGPLLSQACRDALRRDDGSVEAVLEQLGGDTRLAADLLGQALALRGQWRDPFAAAPAEPVAAQTWRYLRGEHAELPAVDALTAVLEAQHEVLLTAALAALPTLPAWRGLAAAWAALDTSKPWDDDKFAPVYRAGRAALAAVAAGAANVAAALVELTGANLSGGSTKVWGPGLAAAKDATKELRAWAKSPSAAVIQADPAWSAASAALTVALLPVVRAAEARFDARLDQLGALTNDDVILRTAQLVTSPAGAEVLGRLRQRYPRILVDEYQDTDHLQDALFRHLAGDRPGAFFAVGDDKQSIYAFRGAEIEVFNRARREAGEGLVELTATFRLAPGLAGVLNEVCRHDSVMGLAEHESLQAARYAPLAAARQPERAYLPGAPVTVLVTPAGGSEPEALAEHLTALVNDPAQRLSEWREGRAEDGVRPLRYGDTAVLFRSMSRLEKFRNALLARDVPVRTERGMLCSRPEVLDLLALARWLESPDDDFALLTVARSPLLGLSDARLLELADDGSTADALRVRIEQRADEVAPLCRWRPLRREHGLSATLRRAVDDSGYLAVLAALADPQRRLANVERLLDDLAALEAAGTEPSAALAVFEQRRDEASRNDPEGQVWDADADAVSLLTVHGAKGLEWPVVYLAELTVPPRTDRPPPVVAWNRLPLLAAVDDEGAHLPAAALAQRADGPVLPFESERLLYVACTRARDRLVLSAALGKDDTWRPTCWFAALADGLGFGAPDRVAVPEVEVVGAPDSVLPEPRPAASLAELQVDDGLTSPAVRQSVLPRQTVDQRASRPQPPHRPGRHFVTETKPWPEAVRRRLTAAQRGEIVHQVLRLAAYRRAAPTLPDVLLAAGAKGALLDPVADLEIAQHLVDTAVAGFGLKQVQEALAAPELLIERPFTLATPAGLVDGRMDLVAVFEDRIMLLDYKTGDPSHDRWEFYRSELGCYREALARRYPDRPIAGWLIFLDRGEAVPVS